MKRLFMLLAFFFLLSLPATSSAFLAWGRTNINYLEYKDFVRDGDGYNITLVNTNQRELVEFYIIIHGTDSFGNVVYRQRFYVDFVPGNGQISYYLPGYNDRIFDMRVMAKQIPEIDTRPHF